MVAMSLCAIMREIDRNYVIICKGVVIVIFLIELDVFVDNYIFRLVMLTPSPIHTLIV